MDAKVKLLYVDDEDINLQLFKIHFGGKYDVFSANNGFEGLKILDNEVGILVVISDMKMPEMNGIEFIEKAKKKYPNKLFFILTGYDVTDEIKKALDTGLIVNFFNKPFDIDKINAAIINVIRNSG